MAQRCPGASKIGVAQLFGYRLGFTRFSKGWAGGVADVVVDEAQSVWGLLYMLTDLDLEALDLYEGYPDAYDRFLASVECKGETIPLVWVYTVVDKQEFIPPVVPYLEILRSASAKLGFPASYRTFLSSIKTGAS